MTPSYRALPTALARLAAFVCAAVALSMIASTADAQTRFRRPFDNWFRVSAYFDNNGSAAGCLDWNCRTQCYDGHTGTDYAMPVGTPVLAGAGGTVVARHDGCANYGSLGNTCGGRCGNYIRLRHDDGTQTIYCHMQLGSLRVNMNDRVGCGQHIGNSASSGSSTGPHLHFGYFPGGTGAARDPYHGGCASGTSVWVSQGPHADNPSTQCQTSCECSPGERRTEACGRCGQRERTCGSDCRWGGWSGCSGEGPCSPGQRESMPCCDCGTQERVCSGSCQWGGWGACGGPDPSPLQSCDTGQPGECAEGAIRCVDGCRSCAPLREPHPEVCDGRDNDCDGRVDEGRPTTLGVPPPPLAATRIDAVLPTAADADGIATGWIAFRNDGTETWPADRTILRVEGDRAHVEAARHVDSWPAWDIAAAQPHATPPGATAVFPFRIRLDDTDRTGHARTLRFAVSVVPGGAIACPLPDASMAFETLPPPPADAGRRVPRAVPDSAPPPAPQGAAAPTSSALPEPAPPSEPPPAPAPQPPATEGAADDAAADDGALRTTSQSGCSTVAPASSTLPLWVLLLGVACARRRRGSAVSPAAWLPLLLVACEGPTQQPFFSDPDADLDAPPADAASDPTAPRADTGAGGGGGSDAETGPPPALPESPDAALVRVDAWAPRTLPYREGGRVVVEGVGLDAIVLARVGGAPAAVVAQSADRIEVRVPVRAVGGPVALELVRTDGALLELPLLIAGIPADRVRWVPGDETTVRPGVAAVWADEGTAVVWTEDGLERLGFDGIAWDVRTPAWRPGAFPVEEPPDDAEAPAEEPAAPFAFRALCPVRGTAGGPVTGWWVEGSGGAGFLVADTTGAWAVSATVAPQSPAVRWHCTGHDLIAERDGAIWSIPPTLLDGAVFEGRAADVQVEGAVYAVHRVDLDADGTLDWLVSFDEGPAAAWRVAADRSLERVGPRDLPASLDGPFRAVPLRLHGPGPSDLLALRPDGTLRLVAATGAGWTDVTSQWAGLADAEPATFVGPFDFDRDGRADLVARRRDGRVVALRNEGARRFTQYSFGAFPPGRPAGVRSFAQTDLDVDLDDDLLVLDDAGRLRPWLLWDPRPFVDSDGDGIPDDADVCPFVADPWQQVDDEGRGQACLEPPDEDEP